uniref:SMP-30/Gluconolactonase/LRE-like region domain-containing protein n=1 Tax=Paramoeba aestuarina TaxID=180227 RepID=A0A7S4PIP0_9EUKA
MTHLFLFVGVVFVAAMVSIQYRHLERTVGFGGEFSAKNDHSCELLVTNDGPFSSEDFAEYHNGLYFVTAGDLGALFGEIKHRAPKKGKIWIVDATTTSSDKLEKRLKEVTINGLPPNMDFHPHGIYFSHNSQILYVLSHGKKGGEQIFTFSPIKTAKKGVESVILKFERALSTPEYQGLNGVFNDVVEGTRHGEYYMTQWLPGPGLPENGHPETFEEHVTHATVMAQMVFLKRTHVHRCTFDPKKKVGNEDVKCEIVASDFSLVNGITTNDARDTYWVADGRNVYELHREKNGQLTRVDHFVMPHMGDNIEWDRETGDLYVGAIPNALKAFQRMGKGLPNEGSLHVIHRENGKMTHSEDVVYHKGNQLGSISAGFIHNNKVFLGSPFHNGVLVCDV